jgi:peptidoglycan/xylan/chitin deacetylase (PgdA/CDA1 family)
MRVDQRTRGTSLLVLSSLRSYRDLGRSLLSLLYIVALGTAGLSLPSGNPLPVAADRLPSLINKRIALTQQRVQKLQATQQAAGIAVVSNIDTKSAITAAKTGNYRRASQQLTAINQQAAVAEAKLGQLGSGNVAIAASSLRAPILMYHKTPPDFEQQLQTLQAKGYTTISMSELAGAFYAGYTLPAKPVVITYDDGFADQMIAFELLKKYSMRATYYIINGGERSHHCIGSNRQPGAPCGDAYLSWEQIRGLDASGLIEIAAHTVDHADLASLPAAEREFQISYSKAELESRLGHPVRHLAYPYGAFTPDVINSVRAAGYVTAVSTIPGIDHNVGEIFALKRVRDAYALP